MIKKSKKLMSVIFLLLFPCISYAERISWSFSVLDTTSIFQILHPVDTVYSDSDLVIIKTSSGVSDLNASGIRLKYSLPYSPHTSPHPFTFVTAGMMESINSSNQIGMGLCDSSGKVFTFVCIKDSEIYYGNRVNDEFSIVSHSFVPEDSVLYRIMIRMDSPNHGFAYVFPENCNSIIDSNEIFFDSSKVYLFLGSIEENKTLRYDFLFASNDEEWLRERIEELRPVEYDSMYFSAPGVVFNYGNMLTDSLLLDMFFELDVDMITIRYTPALYDQSWFFDKWAKVVDRVHKKGKLLAGIYEVCPNTFQTVPTFEEYLQKEIEYSIGFIKSFQPEYYCVIVEPTTMERERTGADFTEFQWQHLVETVSDTLKKLFPGIKTFAVVHKLEFDYLLYFVNVDSLDIIGFNIYGNSMTYPDYYPYGDSVGKAMEYVKNSGKEVWIWETWASISYKPMPYPQSPISYEWWGDDWLASSDSLWIPMMVYYAQKYGAKNILPFKGRQFVFYTRDTTEALDSLLSGARTKTFYSYKNIIEEVRNNLGIGEVKDRNFHNLVVYPNPFSHLVNINYSVPSKGKVSIKIFDLTGRTIRTLIDKIKEPGKYRALWDGRDDKGILVPSGVYFCILRNKGILFRKILFLKER